MAAAAVAIRGKLSDSTLVTAYSPIRTLDDDDHNSPEFK
jgi:hypothetical protein